MQIHFAAHLRIVVRLEDNGADLWLVIFNGYWGKTAKTNGCGRLSAAQK
ncbi:hypothetical protein AAGU66_09005 [Edwardsiella ictaluri]|uniref:Uncharacterized protein n=1 Tax=Edwardsiella ictaluri (strain 93-146) TaxID=634503 RepID=C5BDD4_EDWI9|nr:hypothetical protein [Edwardsiella ictaluri]ACR69251.1 hypothetical protein NT01EI_2075 [Edwardsiella ictaluri 93-146]EKS7773811.1 hypothetical protein [Edwardsiella ictaluri]EKS7777179.1 hypothetical protein [Edwardsiella ictaluri]EKS7800555.1 hypothetical protein [Edwardsiella ictaluri]QPW30205.1 hypothetical protein F8539_09650 [Edwardsiella ictaluri]